MEVVAWNHSSPSNGSTGLDVLAEIFAIDEGGGRSSPVW